MASIKEFLRRRYWNDIPYWLAKDPLSLTDGDVLKAFMGSTNNILSRLRC